MFYKMSHPRLKSVFYGAGVAEAAGEKGPGAGVGAVLLGEPADGPGVLLTAGGGGLSRFLPSSV